MQREENSINEALKQQLEMEKLNQEKLKKEKEA